MIMEGIGKGIATEPKGIGYACKEITPSERYAYEIKPFRKTKN